MHRALQIAEIVHVIMQNLYSGDLNLWLFPCFQLSGRERTLFNAALTCRAFSEPALDALWRYMTSLKPLFALLSNLQPSNKLMDGLLWGSISKTDLRTVKKYASRIRYYYCDGFDDNISIFVYIHLLRACGDPCLLPNLAYLHMDLADHVDIDSADTSKIIFLISPSLREVHINATASSLVPVLNSLQTHTPNVAILNISLFNAHCMSAICSFPQLQEVIINGYNNNDSEPSVVDINFFTRTASNQTLRHFSLCGDMRLISSDLGRETVTFPALQSIHFGCLLTSISPITTLLHYVALPRLKSLSLEIEISFESVKPIMPTEARCWDQFFDLVGNVTTNSFKSLEISYHHLEEDYTSCSPWKDVDLTVSKFPNLDKLSLEKFIIDTPILHSLHPNDVQKIINTWPGLQFLHLTSCQPFKLRFDVLLDIAIGLPNLYWLALSMDLQQLPIPEKIPSLVHGLEHFGLVTSSMPPDAMDFARCVDNFFPRLDSWSFQCSDYPDFECEATSALTMLQRARRCEAKRASLGLNEVTLNDTY